MAKFTQCVKKTRDYADANVFMRPFEIYRAALYNVYGGSRVTDVPYIYNNKHNNIWIASVCIVYVGLAQARPNKVYGALFLFHVRQVRKFQDGRRRVVAFPTKMGLLER